MSLSSVHVGKLIADPVKGHGTGPVARFTVACPAVQVGVEDGTADPAVLVEVETSSGLAEEVLAILRADDEVIVVGQLGGPVRPPRGRHPVVCVRASHVALELADATVRRSGAVRVDPRQPVASGVSELPWSW
jgi:hypothetical protein